MACCAEPGDDSAVSTSVPSTPRSADHEPRLPPVPKERRSLGAQGRTVVRFSL
jgi:hypothetical protein